MNLRLILLCQWTCLTKHNEQSLQLQVYIYTYVILRNVPRIPFAINIFHFNSVKDTFNKMSEAVPILCNILPKQSLLDITPATDVSMQHIRRFTYYILIPFCDLFDL